MSITPPSIEQAKMTCERYKELIAQFWYLSGKIEGLLATPEYTSVLESTNPEIQELTSEARLRESLSEIISDLMD